MKLIRVERGIYETPDGRFRAVWHEVQGAPSYYRVRDTKTDTSLRAFNLDEVRETISDMRKNDYRARGRVLAPRHKAPVQAKVTVYLAVREVPRRFLGTRVDPKFEAELRELVGDKYVRRAGVSRGSRDEVERAARALAARRGWKLDQTRRPSWHTHDVTYERMIAESARDAAIRPRKPSKPRPPAPLSLADFVAELHEVVREGAETHATDAEGRSVELYYGDLIRRLEGAVDLVNDRIIRRSLGEETS